MTANVKGLLIDDDKMTWKNTLYYVTDIRHLAFSDTIIQKRTNFVKTGMAEKVWMKIKLDSGIEIKIAIMDNPIFLGLIGDRSNEVRTLRSIYGYLAKATFQKRLSTYIDQVERNGWFDYDKCRFIPRKMIVYKDKEFHIGKDSFLKAAGYVELRSRDYGALDKIKREVSFVWPPHFKTKEDYDVIFALLKHYFNLSW